LDGIIFPSAQTGAGRNVVLFHDAARVKTLNLPAGTEIDVDTGYETEDGWEPDYSVNETAPQAATPPLPCPVGPDDGCPSFLLSDFADPLERPGECRKPALEVDAESVTVHTVNAVEVQTAAFAVQRLRHVARLDKFCLRSSAGKPGL
ncbi:MAG: RES domain-containing protein, partial [Rubrivivax sp.]